ncbi:hypothetical protein L1887_32595 [Cichorium endivia]|nr:hypothetical protein L1887_32595 [Cichorium endivia]
MKTNLKIKGNDESSGDDFETPFTGHKSQSSSKRKRDIEEKKLNILQDLTESLQRLKEYKLDMKSRIVKALELFPTNDKLLSLLKDFQDEFEVNLQKDSKDDFEKEDSKQNSIEVVTPVGVEETDQVLQTPAVLIESQGFLDDVDKSFDNWNKGKSFEKSLIPSFDLCITQEFEREETEKEDLHSVEIVEEVLGSDLDKRINVTEDVLKKKHYSIHENENDFGKSILAFLKGVEEDTKRQPEIRDFRAVDLV